MLNQAIQIAHEAHRGQTRKLSGLPYIVHPLDVMNIMINEGVTNEYTLSMAVLHDVLEDCDVKYSHNIMDLSYDLFKDLTHLVKADTEEGTIKRIVEGGPVVQMVKCADIYSNTRDLLYPKYAEKKLKQLNAMTFEHVLLRKTIFQVRSWM